MIDPAVEAQEWLESLLERPLTDDQVIRIAGIYAQLAIAQSLAQNKILEQHD